MTDKEQSDWIIPSFSLEEWRNTKDPSKLMEICHGMGFFYLIDHGIPDEFFDQHFRYVKSFFNLPESTKAIIDKRNSRHFRGWERLGAELTSNKVDYREQLDLSTEYEPYPPDITPQYLRLDGPNQWLPDDILPGFKKDNQEFFQLLGSLAWELLEIIAIGFGLSKDYFRNLFGERPLSFVKLIHYPVTPNGEAGVNPHKDAGYISLLVQDSIESQGLQALAPDNKWIDINPSKSAIVVNVGEILQAITGNYCVASVHRVIVKNQRYSSAYFHGPDLRAAITPIVLPQQFQDAVLSSPRHFNAKFMAKREELLDGKECISNSNSALNYGEQLWNYLVRSYPDNVNYHYPEYSN